MSNLATKGDSSSQVGPYGHSLSGQPPECWEPLIDHLQAVADRSRAASSKWRADRWGRLLGLWHDLGKYSAEFQNYLLRENGFEAHIEGDVPGRVDHSTAGAQHAVNAAGQAGRILAYCIAGHHAGLPDDCGDLSSLSERLKKTIPNYAAAPTELLNQAMLGMPPISFETKGGPGHAAFQIGVFTRMLFSALVDGDFLATEQFLNREQAALRLPATPQLAAMQTRLDEHLAAFAARSDSLGSDVQACRQEILADCRDAAHQAPGLFSLTVPTGGGKTLSSLAFALKHARQHELERVIYVAPFTSIIEQTVDVFRSVFDPLSEDIVLEHHSDFDPRKETPRSRLASEHWDAPLVVTTGVQFFESLFAAKTSRCRKLHNIAKSVVILDEAQTLPVEFLKPCLAILQELATNYGTTIVLCTATQPAIHQRSEFPIGLSNVREIMPNPARLYDRMRRVEVSAIGAISDLNLVARLAEHEQFLCIVNTRPHAARLFEMLREAGSDEGLFHLSTRLCGAHRAAELKTIRRRLERGLPCRVISTQLIEAGVDVDFPIVFRSLTGLDSIAQAAGRCNREGRRERGQVFVFEPTEVHLLGYLASIAASGREVLDADDLLSLDNVERYFGLHYWKQQDQFDKHGIMAGHTFGSGPQIQFRKIADQFHLIEDSTQPLLVPWGKTGASLVARLRHEPPDRQMRRQLQRYSVGVRPHELAALGDDIERFHNEYAVLINSGAYDDQLGLRLDRAGIHEPDRLIV